jgi:hypothetical protein
MGQGDVMAVLGENRDGPLFRLPNYPVWFAADTLLLSGSAVHWIVISLMAYELSGFVVVMLALVVLSAALAAFNPLIRALPASPHWAEVEL